MTEYVDLEGSDVDSRLYEAACQLGTTLGRGLPVHELRPAVRADLGQLCAGILDMEEVTAEEQLVFESLQAVTLQSAVDASTGTSLPLDRLLEGATLEELTELLLVEAATAGDGGRGGAQVLRVTVDPERRFEPFPLTDVQQAYLFGREASFELGNVASTFYAELETVDLDLERVERAFNALVERHDALRTIFLPDGFQQVLAQVPDYRIRYEDVSTLDATGRDERLAQLRAELSDTAFPVDRWPLFEVRATRLDDRHVRLHLAFDLLITDGASIARLLGELGRRYVAPDRVWPGLELSFRDYQVAVDSVVGSGRFERARRYWLDRLDGLPAAPQLPLAQALSTVRRPRFTRRSQVLDAAQFAGLRARASRHGVTVSAVLAAAYAVVLGQWSASPRFTLNVTVNSRLPLHRQVNDLVGDFTTLTLLQVDELGEDTFQRFATRLQRQLWTDLDHREFSGVRVMRELARRHGTTNTAMPIVFSSTTDGGGDLTTGPLGEFVDGVVHTPQVYLDHQAFRVGDTLALAWDVVDEVFPVGVVDAMFAAYGGLVSGLAGSDGPWDGPVGALLPADQVAVRSRVNATEGPLPAGLLHRLGGWLSGRAERPAVIAGDRVLSYAELDRAATRVGRRLRSAGVGPNQLVAVVMDKGWEQVVAVLGVLYSGAAYLPIDAHLPAARIRHLLTRGQATVALTQSRHTTTVPWPDGLRPWPVDDPTGWADIDDTPLTDRQQPTDLAYVIFTSGSTGEPKGVMIDHRGAANTITDINTRYHIGAHDRVLALSSLSFDLSVWDIFGILAAGGTIVLPDPDSHRDPHHWAQLIDQHHITVWNTVPALMDMLITHADTEPTTTLHSLRVILLSGDWIPLPLPERILRHTHPTHLESLGGATEASIWSIHHPITTPANPGWPSIPYGTPLTNQTCHILDTHLHPRPDWVPGHLYLAGTGLAHGYWKDPHRTTTAFIHHPTTGQRLYHTGDLARHHPDGTIEFLGRTDTQIKLNGYRIELGEIETTLTTHPTITNAIVTTTNNHLTAYVTPRPVARQEPGTTVDAQVRQWADVYDALTEPGQPGDFDTSGWVSSFTGEPIAEADMRAWVEQVVSRIEAFRPERVLEVGCGTGLVGVRLAQRCASYTGTDISARTLARLRRTFDELGPAVRADVTLLEAAAHELDAVADSAFDCVVLNSVAQYFPDEAYLRGVIAAGLRKLRPDGVFFLGDVRDLRFLSGFHTAVEVHQAEAGDPAERAAWRVGQRRLRERELVVDPALFWSHEDTRAVVLPHGGAAHTEMADYRFDVVILPGIRQPVAHPDRPAGITTLPWSDDLDALTEVVRAIERGSPAVHIVDIPNPRLLADAAMYDRLRAVRRGSEVTVADLRAAAPATAGLRPDDVAHFAGAHGYRSEVFYRPDSPLGHFDAVVTTAHVPAGAVMELFAARVAAADHTGLVNDPAMAKLCEVLPGQLIAHAARTLPDYMVPDQVVVLPELPLSANGKVDRSRLPVPELIARDRTRAPGRAPSTQYEHTLAAIWGGLLSTDLVDVDEDFFRAGGDSLSAVRLASAARAAGLRLRTSDLFAHPTIAELATLAAARALHDDDADGDELPVIEPDPAARFEPFPLTEIQQAYLLGRAGYFDLGNVPATFYVELEATDLDVTRLEAAFNGLVERHDMLRTVVTDDGMQRVQAEVPAYTIAVADCRGLPPDEVRRWLAATRDEMTDRAFDPGVWPLFEVRATLLDEQRVRLHFAIDLMLVDGVSVTLLLGELGRRYVAPDRVWPGLELSFRDYQVAVDSVVGSGRFERARRYWLDRLDGLPAAPQLPLAQALSTVRRPRFTRRSQVLDAAQFAGLRARASRHGVTVSAVLAAAYAVVLGQWSASPRFTLNVTVNSRLPLHRQVNDLVGDFTTLTLLQVDELGEDTFQRFATRLQRQLWTDLDHREFSGVRVMRELARRHGTTNTAMPIVFSSTTDGGGDLTTGPLGEFVDGVVHTPQVYLDHQAFRVGDTLALAWDVVDEVFPVGVVDAMFAAYGGLVSGLAGSDGPWDGPVGALLPADQVAVRSRVNATEGPLPAGLLHRLGGWLSGRAERPAVIAGDRVLSYAELDRAATRVGRRLRSAGVGPNQLVAVVMDKGWEQVVAVLGVLYSGAAYLPIDAHLPAARIRHLLTRGQATVALTQSRHTTTVPWPDGLRPWPVDDPTGWADIDDTPLTDRQQPTDLAYVIFTSGSTGEPKGVMIDHRGAANTITDINTRYHIGAHDRVLALSSLSFDLSVWDIFGILAAGGTIVLPDPDSHRDPHHWAQLIDQHHITVWNTVPALMDMLITHADTEPTTTLHSLRVILLSGDWIPLPLPERILRHTHPTHLESLGGATEASIWSIHHPITTPANPGWPSIPYGTPLTNQTCHILDTHLHPRPDWVPGHLYLAGTGLAHGYWKDPHRTTTAFIHHPTTGQRLYHTGDLARHHPDGTIEFLGRTDTQIKLNGYRIELGEIETTLTTHPTITNAIVTTTNNHLTAYVTTAATSTVDVRSLSAELLDLCRRQLPEWMVPARIVHLDQLPLSSNGKVDRRGLPDDPPPEEPEESRVGPRNEPERILHDIWCELLGRTEVSVFEDFAAAGGDSLLALQVIHRAAGRGVRINPGEFFAHPTIADLAVFAATGPVNATSAAGADVSGTVPLTPRQAAFLAVHPDPPAHWLYTMLFVLPEPLDRTALRVALRAVLRHHDGLRISFQRAGGWSASIAPADEYPMPFSWFDLSGLPPEEQRASVERTCRELQASIELSGPLLRVAYFRSGPAGADLLFVAGHWLMWDNYSCRVFLEDLLGGHDQVVADGEVTLPATTPLAVWAERLTALAGSPEVVAEREYWSRLAVARPSPLPMDGPGANQNTHARTVIAALGPDATAGLAQLTRDGTTTVADVLLAATVRALADRTGGDLVRVELDGHGRNRADVDADPSRTIGRLSTRRPLDIAIDGGADLLEVARRVTASRLAAPMDGANFDLLAYVAGDAGLQATRSEVLFNYLGRVDSLLAPDRLRLADADPGPPHAAGVEREHLLEFLAGSIADDTLLACTYGSSCHAEDTVRALISVALDDVRAACDVSGPVDIWALPPAVKSLHHLMAGG